MNIAQKIHADRRLVRLWGLFRDGLPSVGRYQRYFKILGPVIGSIWILTALYLIVVPRSYTSQFSLILPGSGVGSSINVESIGQAQGTSNSAFASPTLSPTENYKQLLTADVTLRAAARLAHESEDAFPVPTIKLVDQTNLISISISANSAAAAHRRAMALQEAFVEELTALRADEAKKREDSDRARLSELSDKVKTAQRKLIEFQASHGLATLEQFNSRIASVDTLRDKERDLRVQMRIQGGTASRLSGTLGANPGGANVIMRLKGDPVFAELAQRYAAASADAQLKAGTLGPQHSARAQADAESAQLRLALVRRGQELTGLSEQALLRQTDLQVGDGRSNLMQAMSASDAQAAGTRSALAELHGDLARARADAPQWILQAQQLADLQRDQRVTEAVFSSALARLDTNKQDPFASYPLVQVLAAPSLPKAPSSPSVIIALAGALAATFMTLLAFGLLWLRQPILRRMLQSA
ncbi:hypothetical protein NSE01_25190 [Novosphingobium sediminis]|uniref:Polysaccharide chain length determinant N-terminal domain-containing protein n=1 Tax=Novosphingobium sediminis TaxID=707214 RepID=A0A512AM47_9SPHN|nr:DUF748 domain-containing protein [Novosphingobium sediminis]GEO00687.1 hypothetical protein NSE01_25190 [Novosphingobium sediminis]